MEEYIDSKKNLILHQGAFSKTVLNMDNDITNGLSDLVTVSYTHLDVYKRQLSLVVAFTGSDRACFALFKAQDCIGHFHIPPFIFRCALS